MNGLQRKVRLPIPLSDSEQIELETEMMQDGHGGYDPACWRSRARLAWAEDRGEWLQPQFRGAFSKAVQSAAA